MTYYFDGKQFHKTKPSNWDDGDFETMVDITVSIGDSTWEFYKSINELLNNPELTEDEKKGVREIAKQYNEGLLFTSGHLTLDLLRDIEEARIHWND